jgi:uncharacterized protein (DUF433 family)
MSLEVTYPHIEKPDSAPARLQRVPRVRVAQIVMDYLAHGWSAEEMCRQHPYLMPSEVHAALGYYFDHQNEIDAEIRAEWNAAQATMPATPSSLLIRMRAKGIV